MQTVKGKQLNADSYIEIK